MRNISVILAFTIDHYVYVSVIFTLSWRFPNILLKPVVNQQYFTASECLPALSGSGFSSLSSSSEFDSVYLTGFVDLRLLLASTGCLLAFSSP